MTNAKKISPKMTLAEITMPLTRGVMLASDDRLPLLDASMVPEPEGDGEVEVWVTTTVDWSVEEVVAPGVTRGRELVEEVVGWEDVDEVVVGLLAEDEDEDEDEVEVGLVNRVVVIEGGKEGNEDSEVCVCNLVVEIVLVLVEGAPGLRMFEKKDSIGFCAAVVVGRAWRFTRARSTGGMNIVGL
jgi:hypothetical protein